MAQSIPSESVGLEIVQRMGFTQERWEILRQLARCETLTEFEDCVDALSPEDVDFLRVWITLGRESFCQALADWDL